MSEATGTHADSSEPQKADYVFSKDPTGHRYVAHYDDDIVGFATYRELSDGMHFDHTVVDNAHQGQGVASRLVRYALDDFGRTSKLPLIPDCSYVRAWLGNHPEYVHLTTQRP